MSKVLIAEGLGYNLLSVSQLMAKGIHLEADSTTHEFKLFHSRGGLYIGKAVLKNNVFVLDFVPDLGTTDSDGIVTFTSWTHPPDLDPDFSPEGFWYSHTIPEAERTKALATIQHSAAAETTSAAAETSATPTTLTTPYASSSTTSPHIDNTSPTHAQQLTPTPREVHRSANFTAAFYSNSNLYRRSPGHHASEDIRHARMGHPIAARDVIFYERLTLPTYLANLEENRDPTGGFHGDRHFASAADEADWDEQNVDNASEEAGPLPYCSVPIPVDDENPRESVNADTYFDLADTGYVTPAEVNTNEAERIGPNIIPDPETGDEAAYPEDTTLPRYTQIGLQILGLVTAVHGTDTPKEPATVQQALGGEHKEKWREAMDKELKALQERNTWKVVPIGVARNKTILTGKWVFRVKTKSDGTIDKFKARWVVRGFDQEHGRDFTETFAPVSRHTSLRILLAIADMKKKKLRQIDVANAFLYAAVDTEIFVELPHGELQKDLTLTVSSIVTQYLGLNIQEEGAIYLNTAKYADTIAKRFALTPTTISTPYRYTAGNDKTKSAPLKSAGIRNYQRNLGCLLFAAVTCRPDLSYSASQLATYLKGPKDEHMKELDRALHYLVSTPTTGLIYYKNITTTPKLIGYVDADHAGDPDNRRSRTGYIYRLEPIGPISWQSSKQKLIALSSAEAEYIALCSATKEGLYLRELLEEAKLAQLPSFSLFCDNQSAIRIANKNGFANRTKHIALRYFFVKDEIENGRLELSYCPTSEMAADYLTKKLGKSKFEYCMLLTGQSHVTCSDTPEAKGSVGNN
ncbi:unnamed protein product [Closterium sp. NIES-53]